MDVKIVLEAWNKSISKKSDEPIRQYLDSDCTIEYLGRNEIQTKSQHLEWCINNSIATLIDDFKILYNEDGVCAGSHGVEYIDGSRGLIMFLGRYSKTGIKQWTSLVSKNWG